MVFSGIEYAFNNDNGIKIENFYSLFDYFIDNKSYKINYYTALTKWWVDLPPLWDFIKILKFWYELSFVELKTCSRIWLRVKHYGKRCENNNIGKNTWDKSTRAASIIARKSTARDNTVVLSTQKLKTLQNTRKSTRSKIKHLNNANDAFYERVIL